MTRASELSQMYQGYQDYVQQARQAAQQYQQQLDQQQRRVEQSITSYNKKANYIQQLYNKGIKKGFNRASQRNIEKTNLPKLEKAYTDEAKNYQIIYEKAQKDIEERQQKAQEMYNTYYQQALEEIKKQEEQYIKEHTPRHSGRASYTGPRTYEQFSQSHRQTPTQTTLPTGISATSQINYSQATQPRPQEQTPNWEMFGYKEPTMQFKTNIEPWRNTQAYKGLTKEQAENKRKSVISSPMDLFIVHGGGAIQTAAEKVAEHTTLPAARAAWQTLPEETKRNIETYDQWQKKQEQMPSEAEFIKQKGPVIVIAGALKGVGEQIAKQPYLLHPYGMAAQLTKDTIETRGQNVALMAEKAITQPLTTTTELIAYHKLGKIGRGITDTVLKKANYDIETGNIKQIKSKADLDLIKRAEEAGRKIPKVIDAKGNWTSKTVEALKNEPELARIIDETVIKYSSKDNYRIIGSTGTKANIGKSKLPPSGDIDGNARTPEIAKQIINEIYNKAKKKYGKRIGINHNRPFGNTPESRFYLDGKQIMGAAGSFEVTARQIKPMLKWYESPESVWIKTKNGVTVLALREQLKSNLKRFKEQRGEWQKERPRLEEVIRRTKEQQAKGEMLNRLRRLDPLNQKGYYAIAKTGKGNPYYYMTAKGYNYIKKETQKQKYSYTPKGTERQFGKTPDNSYTEEPTKDKPPYTPTTTESKDYPNEEENQYYVYEQLNIPGVRKEKYMLQPPKGKNKTTQKIDQRKEDEIHKGFRAITQRGNNKAIRDSEVFRNEKDALMKGMFLVENNKETKAWTENAKGPLSTRKFKEDPRKFYKNKQGKWIERRAYLFNKPNEQLFLKVLKNQRRRNR